MNINNINIISYYEVEYAAELNWIALKCKKKMLLIRWEYLFICSPYALIFIPKTKHDQHI